MGEILEISNLDTKEVFTIQEDDGWLSTITVNEINAAASLRIGDFVLDEEKLKKIEALFKEKPTNCLNCGGILKDGKCEYCGAEY